MVLPNRQPPSGAAALRVCAVQAVEALAARGDGADDDALADLVDSLEAGAELLDDADGLVSEDEAGLDRILAADDVDVGAANRGQRDPDDRLAGPGTGRGTSSTAIRSFPWKMTAFIVRIVYSTSRGGLRTVFQRDRNRNPVPNAGGHRAEVFEELFAPLVTAAYQGCDLRRQLDVDSSDAEPSVLISCDMGNDASAEADRLHSGLPQTKREARGEAVPDGSPEQRGGVWAVALAKRRRLVADKRRHPRDIIESDEKLIIPL